MQRSLQNYSETIQRFTLEDIQNMTIKELEILIKWNPVTRTQDGTVTALINRRNIRSRMNYLEFNLIQSIIHEKKDYQEIMVSSNNDIELPFERTDMIEVDEQDLCIWGSGWKNSMDQEIIRSLILRNHAEKSLWRLDTDCESTILNFSINTQRWNRCVLFLDAYTRSFFEDLRRSNPVCSTDCSPVQWLIALYFSNDKRAYEGLRFPTKKEHISYCNGRTLNSILSRGLWHALCLSDLIKLVSTSDMGTVAIKDDVCIILSSSSPVWICRAVEDGFRLQGVWSFSEAVSIGYYVFPQICMRYVGKKRVIPLESHRCACYYGCMVDHLEMLGPKQLVGQVIIDKIVSFIQGMGKKEVRWKDVWCQNFRYFKSLVEQDRVWQLELSYAMTVFSAGIRSLGRDEMHLIWKFLCPKKPPVLHMYRGSGPILWENMFKIPFYITFEDMSFKLSSSIRGCTTVGMVLPEHCYLYVPGENVLSKQVSHGVHTTLGIISVVVPSFPIEFIEYDNEPFNYANIPKHRRFILF